MNTSILRRLLLAFNLLAIIQTSTLAAEVANHPSLPPLASKWQGSVSTPKGGDRKVKGVITTRKGDSFTIRLNDENGSVWDWTFQFNRDGRLKTTDVTRVKKARGVKQGPPTGDISGFGEIKGGELSWSFSWDRGKKTLREKFKLTMEEQ